MQLQLSTGSCERQRKAGFLTLARKHLCSRIGGSTLALALAATLGSSAKLLADTHTWTGGAITPNWSTPANWANDDTPHAGEPAPVYIIFPPGAIQLVNVCNLSGLVVDEIVFTGGGYRIVSGSPDIAITLNNPFMAVSCTGTNNSIEVPLVLNATNLTFAIGAGSQLHLSGALTGPGNFKKFGRGDLYLEGKTDNTFPLPATVIGGTVHLGKTGGAFAFGGTLIIGDTNGPAYAGQAFDSVVQLDGDQQMSFNTAVTVNPNGQLKLYGHDLALGSLTMIGSSEVTDGYTGNGTLTLLGDVSSPYVGYFGYHPEIRCKLSLGGNTRTFNIADAFEVTGAVSGGGGSAGIIKTGGGMLGFDYLSTYTGPTLVKEGGFYVDGSLLTSPIQAQWPGYVSGNGSAATVNCQGGGGLYPYAYSGGGNMTTKDVVLDKESTFGVTIQGFQTPSSPSFLTVTGAVTLAGCKFYGLLYTNASFDPGIGAKFTLIQNDGNDPINGTFDSLPEGAKLKFGGREWQVTYHGGTGNDLVLTLLSAQLPLSVDSISRKTNNLSVLDIVGTGVPNIDTYQLQRSTNLTTWITIDNSVYNNNGRLSSYDFFDTSVPARFYRFKLP